MATLRLNMSHRDWLSNLARDTTSCPAEAAAVDDTYKVAAPLVRATVEAKYPPEDMQLLAKYDAAEADPCIRLNLTAGGVTQFTFSDDDAGPMRPNSGGCWRRIYQADEATTAAVLAYAVAVEAFNRAIKAKRDDYYALIRHSTKLEEIEGIWPAASGLRATLNRSVPVVLSDDVVARIRADVAKTAAP